MMTTTSKDGTPLAYDQIGSGPPLVLVDGALCRRDFGPMGDLSKLLAQQFTVTLYDRRGRGQSSDTKPYSAEREVEDLTAICAVAGPGPFLYGTSSGAALVVRALANGVVAKKAYLYEPPFMLEGTPPDPIDFRQRIEALLAEDRRSDAVALFLRVVGVPAFGVFFMKLMRGVWKNLCAAAHTLPYDFAVLGNSQAGGPLPQELVDALAAISVPTRVGLGGKSPDWMKRACVKAAAGIPGADMQVIDGQQHNISAKAMAPPLIKFFT